MNTTLKIWPILLAAAFLFACGGGDDGGDAVDAVEDAAEEVTEAVQEATEEAAEAMEAAGDAMSDASEDEITVIDHSKDEAEFRIKQSLAGVESLIEEIEEAGGDTSDLEEQKEDLEDQLESL